MCLQILRDYNYKIANAFKILKEENKLTVISTIK